MYDSELYHYGVKGMKWGVRKKSDKTSFDTTRNAGPSKTVQNKKENSNAFNESTRKKPLSAKKKRYESAHQQVLG